MAKHNPFEDALRAAAQPQPADGQQLIPAPPPRRRQLQIDPRGDLPRIESFPRGLDFVPKGIEGRTKRSTLEELPPQATAEFYKNLAISLANLPEVDLRTMALRMFTSSSGEKSQEALDFVNEKDRRDIEDAILRNIVVRSPSRGT